MNIDWQKLLRSLIALGLATLVGWAFAFIGMPLGWLIGAMLVMVLISLFNISAQQPTIIIPYVKASVGVMLGATITLPIILSIPLWWPSLLVMVILLSVVGVINFQLLQRYLKFPPNDAALCSMPGGIAEMILMSEQSGADQRRVAIVHAMRIALSILLIPSIASLIFGMQISSGGALNSTVPMSTLDWLFFAMCVASGVAASKWTKLPIPLILVPLTVCAGLHIAGLTDFRVPSLISNVIQVIIGMNVGARFQGISKAALKNAAISSVLVVTIQISFAVTVAVCFSHFVGGDALALMLAYSPGGLAEMSLIAVTMGKEVAFVGLHHVLRVLLCLAAASVLINYLKGKSNEN